MSDLIPKTRREAFLNGLSDSEQPLPEPITREKEFLKKAIEAGGGGGGSVLPKVTSEDNGKVLTVVGGEWDKGENPKELPEVTSADEGKALVVDSNGKWSMGDVGGSDVIVVGGTINTGNLKVTLEKTPNEIATIIRAGKTVILHLEGGSSTYYDFSFSNLSGALTNDLQFLYIGRGETNTFYWTIALTSSSSSKNANFAAKTVNDPT